MTDISKHPLLQQAYDVIQAIEVCGASVYLTDAVTKASALLAALDKFVSTPVGGESQIKVNRENINSATQLIHALSGVAGLPQDAEARMAVSGMVRRVTNLIGTLLPEDTSVALSLAPGKLLPPEGTTAVITRGNACSLQQYLEKNYANGIIDFSVRCTHIVEGDAYFYIHPATVSGETLQFAVRGNIARNQ